MKTFESDSFSVKREMKVHKVLEHVTSNVDKVFSAAFDFSPRVKIVARESTQPNTLIEYIQDHARRLRVNDPRVKNEWRMDFIVDENEEMGKFILEEWS